MGGGEESVENAFGNDGHGCRQRPEKIRATRDPAAAVVHIVASCCTLHALHAIHMPCREVRLLYFALISALQNLFPGILEPYFFLPTDLSSARESSVAVCN